MRHRIAGRKFNRTSSHRKAMFSALATSLFRHEQIKTTLPKAKDLRGIVEPLITKALKGDLAARREVGKTIKDADILKKLFSEIAPRFKKRPGGYTRVLKMGFRQGDCAPMALIELTELAPEEVASPKKETAKKSAPAQKDAKKEEKTEK